MTALPVPLLELIDSMQPLTERFEASGYRLYLVGGVVRDHLLGTAGADIDIDATTDARPETIKSLLDGLGEALWTQGERFGTIGVTARGRRYEITTHRAEVYSSGSRKPQVRFGDDIAADLARRDFTVNAMAVDLTTRELVDPHDGAADLQSSVLRTPRGPELSFSEDPLRMLRAARFCARYGLAPSEAVVEAIPAMLDRLDIVSAERIRDELQKLLMLASVGPGLALLADTGLLAKAVPALQPTVSDAERWDAALARVETARLESEHRWAALLADTADSRAAAEALRMSTAMCRTIKWLVSARALPATIDAPVLRRWAVAAPRGRSIEELLDFAGRHDECRERLAALRAVEPDLDNPRAPLSGLEVAAVLGTEPGPVVGVAMKMLAGLRIEQGPLTRVQARSVLAAWNAERADQPER